MIPKIAHDPSTFFFFTYFGTRARNPQSFVETVPTAAERGGDFSQTLELNGGSLVPVRLFAPGTSQPLPGNAIPKSLINPAAAGLLSYIPLPNQPGTVNNYELQTAAPQDTDNLNGRVQRNITAKDRLGFHFSFQRRDGGTPQAYGFLDSVSGTGLETDLSWTRTISARIISNAQVSFNRNTNETTPFFANGANIAAELGITGTSGNPVNFGPPTLNFTNFGALSDGAPVLTLGPQDELPAADARPPHLPPESAGWAGAGQDAELERRLRTWAIPGALLGFALVHVTGPGRFLMRAFFGREVHECGHALTGWLFGFPSVPLLWVSISSAHRSPLAILAIAAGLASLAVWRWRAKDRRAATVWAGLLVLQLAASLGSSERTAQMFITFGGDAGCLVLGPLLMALFLLGPDRWVNRGWLRWGYLVIGAAAFVDVFSEWWAARTDVDRIPFGEIEGVGLSDPSKLNEI